MILKKKILALVPARGGSKGIELKNLKKINNKSLVEITSDFIEKSKIFDKKILSSDHKDILTIGKKLNFLNYKRSKKLSGDRVSDHDLIHDTLKKIKKNKESFDYLVYLQPTSPIRNTKHFLDTMYSVIKKNLDGAWSVTRIDKKFHPLKVLYKSKNYLKLYLKNGKKIIARQMLSDIYIRNGIFYIFSIKELKKQKTIYLKKMLLSETKYRCVNIDSVKDLKKAQYILKKR